MRFIQAALHWFDVIKERTTDTIDNVFAPFEDEKAIWEDLQKQVTTSYGTEDTTLHIFLQEFDLSAKSSPPPPNAVRCLTIHGAKGLEFEHVYLIGMVEDQLPSFGSIQKGDTSCEMQEERRNCFVAITRVQSTLTLTYAQKYFGWSKRPSRFLREMELISETKTTAIA